MSFNDEKIEVLQWFLRTYPDLVHRMKMTSHHYDSHHLCPYHLEDDVWTHTMMVLKQIGSRYNEEDTVNNYALAISALCHDVGKVFVRQSHTLGKINFWNHSFASIQTTVDFIYSFIDYILVQKKWYDEYTHSNLLKKVLPIICYHIEVWDTKNPYNYISTRDDYENFAELCMADMNGSFKVDCKFKIDEVFNGYNPPSNEAKIGVKHHYHLVCGVPGVGKNTFANEFDSYSKYITDFDSIRIEEYTKAHPNSKESFTDKYVKAFKYCNDKKINLSKLMFEKIKEREEVDIFICNTMTTKKARRAIIEDIKKIDSTFLLSCHYLVCDTENILMRDEIRSETDKSVGESVILKFAQHQELPIYHEGYDNINIMPT